VSYAHYGDGLLQSVSVAGSVLTQSNLLTYSYRGDGLLQTQAVNVSGGATYTYAYTAAGRMTAMTISQCRRRELSRTMLTAEFRSIQFRRALTVA